MLQRRRFPGNHGFHPMGLRQQVVFNRGKTPRNRATMLVQGSVGPSLVFGLAVKKKILFTHHENLSSSRSAGCPRRGRPPTDNPAAERAAWGGVGYQKRQPPRYPKALRTSPSISQGDEVRGTASTEATALV